MLVQAIALLTISQAPVGGAKQPDPAALVSTMIARHDAAQTLSGTIVLTVTIAGDKTTVRTEIQYEKPAKLYIKQTSSGRRSQTWYVTSDGTSFSYDAPARPAFFDKTPRLIELVHKDNGMQEDIRTMYSAAIEGLGDKSLPLDLAIGRRQDLVLMRDQLVTLEYRGKQKIDEGEAHVLGGLWRERRDRPVTGTFTMAVTSAGDLLHFGVSESMSLEGMGNHDLKTDWSVRLSLNGAVDQRLFRVVK